MSWRPSRPVRWAIVAGVFLLAAIPAVVGFRILDDYREEPMLPMALIVFGPMTVVSLFIAVTPVLEGWWLRRHGKPGDRLNGEQENGDAEH